MSGNLIS